MHVVFGHLGTLGQSDRIVGALETGHDGFDARAHRISQLARRAEVGPLPDRIIQYLNFNLVFGLGFGHLRLGKRVGGDHVAAAAVAMVAARFFDNAHVHHERHRRVAKRAAIDVTKRFSAAAPRSHHRFCSGRRFGKLCFFLQRQAEIEVVKIKRTNYFSVIANCRRFLNECWLHLVQRIRFAIHLNVVETRNLGADVGHFGLSIHDFGIDFQGVVIRFLHDESGRQQGFNHVVKINFGNGCNMLQISGSKPYFQFQ